MHFFGTRGILDVATDYTLDSSSFSPNFWRRRSTIFSLRVSRVSETQLIYPGYRPLCSRPGVCVGGGVGGWLGGRVLG